MATKHTHKLARQFEYIEDGKRIPGQVGDLVTPTEAQLQNMPDCFLTLGDAPVTASKDETGVLGMSVSAVKALVPEIHDRAELEKMAAEERGARDRVGVARAIEDRLDELDDIAAEAAVEDGADGEGED